MSEQDLSQLEQLERLERLARATQDITPDAGFDSWIMQGIEARVPPAQSRLANLVLLACFAAAAAAAVMITQVEQHQLDSGALSLLDSLDTPQ